MVDNEMQKDRSEAEPDCKEAPAEQSLGTIIQVWTDSSLIHYWRMHHWQQTQKSMFDSWSKNLLMIKILRRHAAIKKIKQQPFF